MWDITRGLCWLSGSTATTAAFQVFCLYLDLLERLFAPSQLLLAAAVLAVERHQEQPLFPAGMGCDGPTGCSPAAWGWDQHPPGPSGCFGAWALAGAGQSIPGQLLCPLGHCGGEAKCLWCALGLPRAELQHCWAGSEQPLCRAKQALPIVSKARGVALLPAAGQHGPARACR